MSGSAPEVETANRVPETELNKTVMYTITQIEETDRRRKRVFLDGAFAFVLYQAELRKYGIAEGGELTDEAYAEITQTLLPLRAKKRAMHLLEKRPYTEKALRDKLSDGDYPEVCVDAAIDYVKSYGYINDLQYAIDHISYHLENRPKRRLETDLLKKGVDKALITEAFERCAQELSGAEACAAKSGAIQGDGNDSVPQNPERQMIEKELRKKRFDPETADYETRAKMLASLVRKGFDPELVREMLKGVSF